VISGFIRLSLVFAVVLSVFFGAFGVELDRSRYIGVDEIERGMEGYCLTIYEGTRIEKFGIRVLSVMHNYDPGKDAILVEGTDERFIHSGPVAGCSGSPVYIDGRLAGALSFGWLYSKDPLYGVMPIKQMLEVGTVDYKKGGDYNVKTGPGGFADESGYRPMDKSSDLVDGSGYGNVFGLDYSEPIDFQRVYERIMQCSVGKTGAGNGGDMLVCPVAISGGGKGLEQIGVFYERLGLMPVAGIGGGSTELENKVELEPGSALMVPLVSGDVSITVYGTTTEVVDDKVYGFGHAFLGYGKVDLPMATGQIHAISSSVVRSFKIGSAIETVGALRNDESSAIVGRIGAKAKTIPMTVGVRRYNSPSRKLYRCELAVNKLLTPVLAANVLMETAMVRGDFESDNLVEYNGRVKVTGQEDIEFSNMSSGVGVMDVVLEAMGTLGLLMNNPYEKVEFSGIDFDVEVTAQNALSAIWSAQVSDEKVRPGGKMTVTVVLQSVRSDMKRYEFQVKVPEDLPEDEYELIITGAKGYSAFLKKNVPYRFMSQDVSSLVDAINNVTAIKRDRLYCLLVLPDSGVTIDLFELEGLPGTKAMILADGKRSVKASGYKKWIEQSIRVGKVVLDQTKTKIKVEK